MTSLGSLGDERKRPLLLTLSWVGNVVAGYRI